MARKIEEVIQRHHFESMKNPRILDWGCGCGRVTRWLPEIFPKGKFVGADIDSENIEWCQTNIPKVQFNVFPLLPPTELNSRSVDVAFGISVITHLSLDVQTQWAAELARLVVPGGLLLMTYNGPDIWARIASQEVIGALRNTGADDSKHDHNLRSHINDGEYYRLTFQRRATIIRQFKGFTFVQEYPGLNISGQDLIVLRRNL